MTLSTPPSPLPEWQALHARAEAWASSGGNAAEAREIVARITALQELRGASADPGVVALRAWRKNPVPRRPHYPAAACWVAGLPVEQRAWHGDGAAARLAFQLDAPPRDQFWLPASDTNRPEEAVDEVHAMGFVLEDPNERTIEVLCALLRCRPRSVWTAAVVALSRLAQRSPERRAAMEERLRGTGPALKQRHRVVLNLALAARRVIPPLDSRTFWKEPDASDASALLEVAVELMVDGVPPAGLLPFVREALAVAARHRAEAAYQLWEALRRLVPLLPEDVTGPAWELLLDEASGEGSGSAARRSGEGALIGSLIDAGLTLIWLRESGREALVPRLLAGRLRAAPVLGDLAWAARTGATWPSHVQFVLDRLQLLREAIWYTTGRAERAVGVAELVWALRHPAARDWRWIALLERAGLPAHGFVGEVTVAAAMTPGLLQFLVPLKSTWMELEHGDPGTTDSGVVAAVVRGRWRGGRTEPDEKLTNLAAVLILRRLNALEERGGKAVAADFLLQVFRADRLVKARREDQTAKPGKKGQGLWSVIRGDLPVEAGAARWVQELVLALEGVETLHQAEVDEGARALKVAKAWTEAIRRLCPTEQAKDFLRFAEMVQAADDLVGPVAPWRQRFRRAESRPQGEEVVWQRRLEGLIGALGEWLMEGDDRVKEELTFAAEVLVEKITAASEDRKIDHAELEDIIRQLNRVREAAVPGGHSIESAIGHLCGAIEEWVEEIHRETVADSEQRRTWQDQMQAGDENALGGLNDVLCRCEEKAFDRIGPALLGQLGRFWWRRLNFRRAWELRHAEARWRTRSNGGDGQQVPSGWAHFSPLIVGVCAGPLATVQLDGLTSPMLGALAGAEGPGRFVLAVAVCLLVSFLLLWTDVRRRANGLPGNQLAKRMVLPGVGMIVFSCTVAGLVLWLKEGGAGVKPATVLLWGSLSLFQGVFLGLIAQGRSSMNDS